MARIKPLMEVLNGVTRFGRLTVLGEAPRIVAPSGFAAVAAFVRCDCGVEKIVRGRGLVTGYTNSCGCLQRELTAVKIAERTRTHGRTKTVEYHTWTTMKQRCLNPADKHFANYGARGITVCDRWRDSFEAFFADMGERPADKTSIDRIDNDRGYEPGNCRWADDIEQHNNKRNNRYLEVDGERATIGEWARRTGQSMIRIHHRLTLGWPDKEAVFGPTTGKRYLTHHPRARFVDFRGQSMQISDAAKSVGLTASDLSYHMKRGRTADEAADIMLANRAKRERKSA